MQHYLIGVLRQWEGTPIILLGPRGSSLYWPSRLYLHKQVKRIHTTIPFLPSRRERGLFEEGKPGESLYLFVEGLRVFDSGVVVVDGHGMGSELERLRISRQAAFEEEQNIVIMTW